MILKYKCTYCKTAVVVSSRYFRKTVAVQLFRGNFWIGGFCAENLPVSPIMNSQIAPIVYRQSLRNVFYCKRSYSGPVDRWMKEPDDPKYPKEKFKGMVGRPLNDDDYQIRDDRKLKVDLVPDTGYE